MPAGAALRAWRRCARYGRVRADNGGLYCAQHWRMIQAVLGIRR